MESKDRHGSGTTVDRSILLDESFVTLRLLFNIFPKYLYHLCSLAARNRNCYTPFTITDNNSAGHRIRIRRSLLTFCVYIYRLSDD